MLVRIFLFRIDFLKLQIVFPNICLHKRILIGRSAQRSMAYKQVSPSDIVTLKSAISSTRRLPVNACSGR